MYENPGHGRACIHQEGSRHTQGMASPYLASACFWLQACVQSRRYFRHFVNWGMIKMMS